MKQKSETLIHLGNSPIISIETMALFQYVQLKQMQLETVSN